MNKILRLDPNYDLWLSYTWSNNNHGICGHTYEIIDYYHILTCIKEGEEYKKYLKD